MSKEQDQIMMGQTEVLETFSKLNLSVMRALEGIMDEHSDIFSDHRTIARLARIAGMKMKPVYWLQSKKVIPAIWPEEKENWSQAIGEPFASVQFEFPFRRGALDIFDVRIIVGKSFQDAVATSVQVIKDDQVPINDVLGALCRVFFFNQKPSPELKRKLIKGQAMDLI